MMILIKTIEIRSQKVLVVVVVGAEQFVFRGE
jgi:hypothetical protein